MPTNLKDFFNDNRKTFFLCFNIVIFKEVNLYHKRYPLFLFPGVSFISEVTSTTEKIR
jgi:hypothetical protein